MQMVNFWQKLKKPIFALAPMDEVTDVVFRQIISEIGKPDVLFTEFVNCEGLQSAGQTKLLPRLDFTKQQRPIIAQIWGINPENFYKTAQLIKQLGFDGIDLNMGCPDKTVIKRGACSALIENPQLAQQIILATQQGAQGLPVSVKTRIGVKNIITEDWIGFLIRQNLAAIIIHGRTVKEMSKVPCHWEEIGRAVQLRNNMKSQTLILGNGDIKSIAEGEAKITEYSLDGVMIGRGIFQNPWIFSHNQQTHSVEERLELLLRHTQL
ncbi:MAG: tRNA-dihydrouridine synthase family protein, partial [Patescibacteria group bacterium]|nr:tRNA-dihydrouridine synthase family protein [Patescibacteria group bacterium]